MAAVEKYIINSTWDSQPLSNANEHIYITLTKNTNILVEIDAPLYNDPKFPDEIPKGAMDFYDTYPKLWDYEVVELFFLGDDKTYLEIELSPTEHYLAIQIQQDEVGERKILASSLQLSNFIVEKITNDKGQRWYGKVEIPLKYFPSSNNVMKFNAYAIHGSNEKRMYCSLYPVPLDKYEFPNFHRLQYFQNFTMFQ